MRSQILILVPLIIGTIFFQPTSQNRLSRRELTEYDLTSFIVSTCSFDQTDSLVQGLCDQTLQSALMGNFPFLIYYCKTIGAEARYCKNVNQYTVNHQEPGAKRYTQRRFVRSLARKHKAHRKNNFDMNTETDSHEKQITQICIIKTDESSASQQDFCNQALEEVEQGRYPQITRLCEHDFLSHFCRRVRSRSSVSTARLLPTHSSLPTNNPPFDSSSPSAISN